MKIWMNYQEVIYQKAWTVEISINHLLFSTETGNAVSLP